MSSFDRWIDRQLERLCSFFAMNGAPDGGVARLGYAFAGVAAERHLPVERVGVFDQRLHRDRDDGGKWTGMNGSSVRAGGTDDRDTSGAVTASSGGICAQPQYCNIYGKPCACCGGSDASCPSGTNKGAYWSGSCGGRNIWFTDCCNSGGTACPSSCPFCANSSSGQPSWCAAAGPHYVCTLAEDKGPSGSSTPGS